jgi:hypothetical protein
VTTLDKLRAIPDLAALVYLSADTPHRPPGRSKHGKLTNSPMPPSVSAWDMLRPDEHGLMEPLIQAAERIRETMTNPPDMPTPTWVIVCSDIITHHEHWNADPSHTHTTDNTCDCLTCAVTNTTRTTHRDLSRWVGEQPPRPLRCTKCRGHVHRDRYGADGSTAVACSDCGHQWHPKDLAHEATMATPAPLPAIASLLGLTERTLQRWVSAGLAHPTTDHTPTPRQPAMYLPQDLARLATMIRKDAAV